MSELPGSGSNSDEEGDNPGGFENPPASPVDSTYFNPGNRTKPPEGVSWGDWMLKPNKPLSAAHKRVAELLVTTRMSTEEIAKEMGWTAQWIYMLKSNTKVKQEMDRIRDRLFDKNVAESLQNLGPDAIRILEEVITTDNQVSKEKIEIAKWIAEMVGGKAKQQIAHEAGSSILDLLKRLDQLGAGPAGNAAARDVLELSPAEAEEDAITKWARENTGEKK